MLGVYEGRILVLCIQDKKKLPSSSDDNSSARSARNPVETRRRVLERHDRLLHHAEHIIIGLNEPFFPLRKHRETEANRRTRTGQQEMMRRNASRGWLFERMGA